MKSLPIYIAILFPIIAIAQQMPDSTFMVKHPLTVSYCGITGPTGNLTFSQIKATDSLVLLYNYGNKWVITSFKMAYYWEDFRITYNTNYIPPNHRAAIAKIHQLNDPYFDIEWVYVKNKDTGETKQLNGKIIKIIPDK